MQNAYTFREFEFADLQIIKPWLSTPSVRRWYSDPNYIKDIEAQIDDKRMQMRIVSFTGRAFAYLQDYSIHEWKDHHLAFLPNGSRGLDTFIGEPSMIGKGHGPNYLSAWVESLFDSGVPALGIDPHPDNTPAIRAYEKIGFKGNKKVSTEWGLSRLMSICR